LRVLPDAENCRSRKRRGSRSTSIPTARTPSSTDQDASAAATRKAGSRTMALSNAPPNSAPWRACGNVDNAAALSTVPQENRTRRSGQMMCYQKNRTTSFAIDRDCRPSHCLSAARIRKHIAPPRHVTASHRRSPAPTLSGTQKSLLPPSEQDVAERSVVCSIDGQAETRSSIAASSSEKLDRDVLEPNRRIGCGPF
jgi:hypothetical protein